MTSTELLKAAEERLSIASYQLEMSKNLNNNRLQKAKEDEYDFLREVVFYLRAQQDTPPNDPLALEELREMDGEPVWVQYGQYDGEWIIVAWNIYDAISYVQKAPFRLFAHSYGETWLAYHRKPEEGTA